MIETLPATVSRVGLEVQTSDLTIMLLGSLPHNVHSCATLHAIGNAYTDFRTAALRFETQQRMFAELSGHLHRVHEVCMHWKVLKLLKSGGAAIRKVMTTLSTPRKKILMINGNGTKMQVWISATVAKGKGSPKSTVKCHLCGRRGHMAKQCKADMSKVKMLSLLQVWSHRCPMPRQAQRFNRETAKEASAESRKEQRQRKDA